MLSRMALGRSLHGNFITSVMHRRLVMVQSPTLDEGGQVHCALLMAKARLAPLKSISILELSAATVAVRLAKMIRTELESVCG